MPFRCSLCNKTFACASHLKRHIGTHSGDAEHRYCCYVCNKSFVCPSHLKRHIRSHSGEQPFSCSVCCKKYSHASHLSVTFIATPVIDHAAVMYVP